MSPDCSLIWWFGKKKGGGGGFPLKGSLNNNRFFLTVKLLCYSSNKQNKEGFIFAWQDLDDSHAVGNFRTHARAALCLYCGLGHAAACIAVTAQTLTVVLCKDQQHERVDAAVWVAQADADVVGIDKGWCRLLDTQVDHLDHMVRCPAQQEECYNHQNHLGGSPGPQRLLALYPAHRLEYVVQGQRVEGTDDDEGHQETQRRLVQGVPVHVLGTIEVYHAHTWVILGNYLGIDHDRDSEEETAEPHQQVDDDGPLDGSVLWHGMDDGNVPLENEQRMS